MAIEVKGGANVSIRDLRALHGVLDNDANYPCLQMANLEGKRFDTPGAVERGLKQPQLRLQDRL